MRAGAIRKENERGGSFFSRRGVRRGRDVFLSEKDFSLFLPKQPANGEREKEK